MQSKPEDNEGSNGNGGKASFGLRYGGAVGIRLWKIVGVEGTAHSVAFYGPNTKDDKLYTTRLKLGANFVLKF